jgi:hypothetical protein
MIQVVVYPWTADAGVCVENTVTFADIISGADNKVDDTTCSYVTWFDYYDGRDSAGVAISSTT